MFRFQITVDFVIKVQTDSKSMQTEFGLDFNLSNLNIIFVKRDLSEFR